MSPRIYSYYDDSLPYGGETVYATLRTRGSARGLVSKSWGYWWVDREPIPSPGGDFVPDAFCDSKSYKSLEAALRALVMGVP